MTTMDDETLRAMLDGLRRGSVWITADRCQGDSVAVNAFCDLVRAAPALAAEVLRLRDQAIVDHAAFDRLYAELDRLRAEAAARRHALCDALGLDAHTREYGGDAEVDAAIAALRAERDALRAIVEGRTTPSAVAP